MHFCFLRNYFFFNSLLDCEKLSEVLTPLGRTSRRSYAQYAVVLSVDPAVNEDAMTKQTKITIETDSLLLLRGRNSTRAHCPLCNAESEMVEVENLQVVSNLDRSSLEEWINSGELHRLRGDDGSSLICLNSLLARIRNTTTL
jgi:hypothetical protein